MLGAHTVLVGRPALWGLTCKGADGVAEVLGLLGAELTEAMLLCGLDRPADADSSLLCLPHAGLQRPAPLGRPSPALR